MSVNAATEAVIRKCSVEKVFLKIFTGKYLHQILFYNKVAGPGLQLY